MPVLLPFRALRPAPGLAERVAAPPYDVVDVAEARALAAGNPDSFLHVSRPEIDLADDVDGHADEVHAQGRAALDGLVSRGVLRLDAEATLLVYRLQVGDAAQTGVVGCAAVADYRAGAIATHEHTRPDKEADRAAHMDALAAHDEPVLLMYGAGPAADAVRAGVADVTAANPLERVTGHDGVEHTLWAVPPGAPTDALTAAFATLPRLYLADGHHRSAAAAVVATHHGGAGESARFPVVACPADELSVLAYNRVVADLGGHSPDTLIAALSVAFDVTPAGAPVAPAAPHTLGMHLDGRWFALTVREALVPADPVARLDVSLLQALALGPLLGVGDVRTDPRIAFVGGSRGTAELERLVGSGAWAVAFSLHPTSPYEVMDVADRGEVMPPKSTWFAPKLASGLFVHPFGAQSSSSARSPRRR